MSKQNSDKFFVGSIIIFLIIFLIIKVILISVEDMTKNIGKPESMSSEAVTERIAPVAKVNVGEAPVTPTPAVEEDTSTNDVGTKIVTQVCAMCHSTGMMSSPKLGDANDWAPRIKQGMDTLYSHAINGFNMMPARGGRPDLTDDEVKAAVDHMVSLVK